MSIRHAHEKSSILPDNCHNTWLATTTQAGNAESSTVRFETLTFVSCEEYVDLSSSVHERGTYQPARAVHISPCMPYKGSRGSLEISASLIPTLALPNYEGVWRVASSASSAVRSITSVNSLFIETLHLGRVGVSRVFPFASPA